MSLLTRHAAAPMRMSMRCIACTSSTYTSQLRYKSTRPATASSSSEATSAPQHRFPEMFDQTVVLSNGATFTLRTPSPRAQIRLTRDTRNHPLWNPELRGQSTGDESGQLSKFAKKFGEDLDDLLDLDFADGGDVDRKALTAKQIAQATPQKNTGKKRK